MYLKLIQLIQSIYRNEIQTFLNNTKQFGKNQEKITDSTGWRKNTSNLKNVALGKLIYTIQRHHQSHHSSMLKSAAPVKTISKEQTALRNTSEPEHPVLCWNYSNKTDIFIGRQLIRGHFLLLKTTSLWNV